MNRLNQITDLRTTRPCRACGGHEPIGLRQPRCASTARTVDFVADRRFSRRSKSPLQVIKAAFHVVVSFLTRRITWKPATEPNVDSMVTRDHESRMTLAEERQVIEHQQETFQHQLERFNLLAGRLQA